jgi:glyoxylase-like metal-dependent hydrolase (beta-lactamase superfamily II)
VLIDTGTLGDLPDLERGLAAEGLGLRDLAAIVVTHAHGDHAGLAAELRRQTGATVILGAADADQARRGENDTLIPTGLSAALLKPFIPKIFPPFDADRKVDTRLDLGAYGIGGEVVAMPGHTAGSVVVILANHAAFVGDVMAGGAFGGAVFPSDPGEHYYHADRARNRANIQALLDRGVERFYLGHGGPVTREDVIRAFPK